VAANKVASDDVATLSSLRSRLDLAEDVPLLAVDAKDRESVKGVLLGLLYRILDCMS
jgi:signal recognition particle receptor subunit beta